MGLDQRRRQARPTSSRRWRRWRQTIAQMPLTTIMTIKQAVKRAWEGMGMRVNMQNTADFCHDRQRSHRCPRIHDEAGRPPATPGGRGRCAGGASRGQLRSRPTGRSARPGSGHARPDLARWRLRPPRCSVSLSVRGGITMTTKDSSAVHGEHRMLIDGKLVEAKSGKVFDNINPATEEVLGQVADAGHEDMDEAIGAARRAFDETAWSTDKELRKRCLLQLQAALEEERELLRAELVAEVGRPDPAHLRAPARCPPRRGPDLAGQLHRRVRLGAGPARGQRPSARAAGARWPRRPSASSAPSSRGTTPSRSPSTSSARRWPPATP